MSTESLQFNNIYDFFLDNLTKPNRSLFVEKYNLNLSRFIEEVEDVKNQLGSNIADDETSKDMKKVILFTFYEFRKKYFSFDDFLVVFFRSDLENKHFDLIKSIFNHSGFKLDKFLADQKELRTIKYTKEIKEALVYGRDLELTELILTLKRLKKSNPILVGEAGVGKTAIIQKLSKYIQTDGELNGYKILELDLMGISSGAKFKGELEKRFSTLLEEVKKNQIILFIDEIHTLRSLDGSNIINLLKPYLARGDLKIIGATTLDEFNSFIKNDKALSRRFKEVLVEEPSDMETFEIIKNVKQEYESQHKIKFDEKSLKKIIKYSSKYNRFGKNPDKSLEMLDDIGSFAFFEKRKKITENYVEKYFSKKYNIQSKNFQEDVKKKVLQQDEVVDSIYNYIKAYEREINDKTKPIGSFLFVGESGSGKTFLSENIANYLGFNYCRFDMSEYNSSADINKFIGSSAGYVGYNEPTKLSLAFKKSKQNVFVFDEIEKAHSEVMNIFLQIMDYGKVTLSNGEELDFRNSIIVFTSNSGVELNNKSLGLVSTNKSRKFDVSMDFSPEFLDRLSSIYHFKKIEKNINFIKTKIIEIFKNRGITGIKISENFLDQVISSVDISSSRSIERFFNNEIVPLLFSHDLENVNLMDFKDNEYRIISK